MAPIDGIRFVHAAIVNEARDIELQTHSAATPEEAGALLDRLEFYAELIDGHTRGEELGLFPPLVQRNPHFADTYLLDHDDERALLAEVVALARECQVGDASALERLRRQTVALTEHAESHVRKENELVLPVCREMFPPAEQGAMVSTMLSAFSPEVMARAAGWIVSKVDADTGAAYLGELSAVMPAPVFDGTKASVRDTVGPQRWSELVERSPALA